MALEEKDVFLNRRDRYRQLTAEGTLRYRQLTAEGTLRNR